MKKFRVCITGELDYDYEVEADGRWEAEALAQDMFERDHQVMWSGINIHEVEELEENES